MRADEAITIENADSMFVGMNYINQLRYERLMAKAEMFKGECYTRWCASKTKKNLDTYAEQFHSLGKIYEERAKKIKDGMS